MQQATRLPKDIEARLRKDLKVVSGRLEEVLVGKKPNYRVVEPAYINPVLDKEQTVPNTDSQGSLYHYFAVRGILEYGFEHHGVIKEKYRNRMRRLQAPAYLMALLDGAAEAE